MSLEKKRFPADLVVEYWYCCDQAVRWSGSTWSSKHKYHCQVCGEKYELPNFNGHMVAVLRKEDSVDKGKLISLLQDKLHANKQELRKLRELYSKEKASNSPKGAAEQLD